MILYKYRGDGVNWDRKLSGLELRALCAFIFDEKNGCKIVETREYPDFMSEGLKQTLYVFEKTNEYVFVARQKGYIIDAVHIVSDEIEEFKTFWNQGMLTPYGHIKNVSKSK